MEAYPNGITLPHGDSLHMVGRMLLQLGAVPKPAAGAELLWCLADGGSWALGLAMPCS